LKRYQSPEGVISKAATAKPLHSPEFNGSPLSAKLFSTLVMRQRIIQTGGRNLVGYAAWEIHPVMRVTVSKEVPMVL
jgi:hypothetical protein